MLCAVDTRQIIGVRLRAALWNGSMGLECLCVSNSEFDPALRKAWEEGSHVALSGVLTVKHAQRQSTPVAWGDDEDDMCSDGEESEEEQFGDESPGAACAMQDDCEESTRAEPSGTHYAPCSGERSVSVSPEGVVDGLHNAVMVVFDEVAGGVVFLVDSSGFPVSFRTAYVPERALHGLGEPRAPRLKSARHA